MRTMRTPPPVLPQANDPCWCGSGRKYKRCHKRSEGRVLPGVVSPMRDGPGAHRPPAVRRDRRTSEPVGRAARQVARGHRADAPRRLGRRRDPPPGRRDGAPRASPPTRSTPYVHQLHIERDAYP